MIYNLKIKYVKKFGIGGRIFNPEKFYKKILEIFRNVLTKINKKLAVIGASYLQQPLVEKAKEMGLEVHCFAWEDGAVCKGIADHFYPISIIEKEEILSICQQVGINGICTIASDVAAPTVVYVAEKMGLVGNSYKSAVRANNKYLMRESFSKADVPCPKYMVATPDTLNTP